MIAAHASGASIALLLGALNLARPAKGDRLHRRLGLVWVVAMYRKVLSSFAIKRLHPGHASWIHGLSIFTVITLSVGLWAAITGRTATHRGFMTGSYLGLVGARSSERSRYRHAPSPKAPPTTRYSSSEPSPRAWRQPRASWRCAIAAKAARTGQPIASSAQQVPLLLLLEPTGAGSSRRSARIGPPSSEASYRPRSIVRVQPSALDAGALQLQINHAARPWG